MSRDEAIAAAPSSRREYWVTFLGCAIFPVAVIAADVLLRHRPQVTAVLSFLLFITPLVLIAAQSAERLFYPVTAAQRCEALSPVVRKWLIRVKSICFAAFCVLYGLRILAFILNSHSRVNSGLAMLVALPLVVISFLRDLLGEKYWRILASADRPSVADMKPLQSEHWGESKPLHKLT